MFIPYDLSKTKSGYRFTTDFGITYYLYFSAYYFTDLDGSDLMIPMFGFYCVPEEKMQHDPRIKATIITLIQDYFEKNPGNGMLYLCDQKGGKARNRRIVFGAWHREIATTIEKHDSNDRHASLGFYSSLLVARNNPEKGRFIAAFYRHLDEMLP